MSWALSQFVITGGWKLHTARTVRIKSVELQKTDVLTEASIWGWLSNFQPRCWAACSSWRLVPIGWVKDYWDAQICPAYSIWMGDWAMISGERNGRKKHATDDEGNTVIVSICMCIWFLLLKIHLKINLIVLGHMFVQCELQLSELQGKEKQIIFFLSLNAFSGTIITTFQSPLGRTRSTLSEHLWIFLANCSLSPAV